MPESSTSSFIPKRNPGKKPQPVQRYNLFVLSIISYALFVAAPLASAAIFIYERHTLNQFNAAVLNLESQIKTFNEVDLARVVEFDERLKLTQKLLASHVSFVSLLSILESATADTVQFKDLKIARTDQEKLEIDAILTTSAFDGALFQRGEYDARDVIDSTVFSDVMLIAPSIEEEAGVVTEVLQEMIEFKAEFAFTSKNILYTPFSFTAPVTESVLPTDSASSTDAAAATEGAAESSNESTL